MNCEGELTNSVNESGLSFLVTENYVRMNSDENIRGIPSGPEGVISAALGFLGVKAITSAATIKHFPCNSPLNSSLLYEILT